jgi:hypothetical protein
MTSGADTKPMSLKRMKQIFDPTEKYHLVSDTQLRDIHAWGIGISPYEPFDPEDARIYPIPDGEKIIREVGNCKIPIEHQIRMIVLNRLGDKMYQEFHAYGNLTGREVVSKMYKLIEEVMEEDGGRCH